MTEKISWQAKANNLDYEKVYSKKGTEKQIKKQTSEYFNLPFRFFSKEWLHQCK